MGPLISEKSRLVKCYFIWPDIYRPSTQMTHILEDLAHKIEGQPPKKRGRVGSRYIFLSALKFTMRP